MSFEIPESVRPVRARVKAFIEERIYPVEHELEEPGDAGRTTLRRLMQEAKDAGLWALGHPVEIGGQGMPFMDYVYVNEVIGRSEYAQVCLGTHSLQDSIMLNLYAAPEWRDRYLKPLVAGEVFPSFGMTEPDVAGSDPTQIQTRAVLDGDDWVINGRKWFTTGARNAAYTTVMARTEDDGTPPHAAFSMIVVPTDTPGYNILRETPVMGMLGGHCEVAYEDVRVPRSNLLGPRGQGFTIAQQRLGPGRIFHCMRWLGQAQRAFDLMCERANSRIAFGSPLADKQQVQAMIFETAAEIQACRLLTLQAAHQMDTGDPARVAIGIIKVVGAKMLHNTIDRAIQVFGAAGVTSDWPLERMYRHARFARIYDGPDEVHRQTVARLITREYRKGAGWDFAEHA